ncbi:MAG: TrbC/VirB2 family protein [Candidatus Peribacteraceae bacterium]|nr:TrbC/VirB2 family protein [Candidatus Peribacteraceae bacterium]
MKTFFNNLSIRASATVLTLAYTPNAYAAIFGDTPDIGGISSIRGGLTTILDTILSYMAILAVIFIVVAGVRLVVSQGEDSEKDKAKKTIIYVIAGLIIILLAKAIVTFVATDIGGGA